MSDFSDKDDRDLVQLVVEFQDEKGKIDWQRVATRFGPRKTKLALRQRLKTLKRTHGRRLEAFPRHLLCVVPQRLPPRSKLAPCTNALMLTPESFGSFDQQPQVSSGPKNQRNLYMDLDRIFAMFTNADVRQPSGHTSMNVGEIAQVGITRLLDRLQVSSGDAFCDIGSGTGNVLAQVALETSVAKCIGIEIRYSVAKKSRAAFKKWSLEFPRLSCISVLTGDIQAPTRLVQQELMKCTVIYANNKLFSPPANLQLQRFICSSSAATVIVLVDPFCSRCRPGCTKEFCQVWEIAERVLVEACWTKQVYVYVYRRRVHD
jgi:hypothetical protein